MTTQIEIGRVTRGTVELRGPQTATVSWETLRAAASQDDPELRQAYGAALQHAERIRAGQIQAEIDAATSLVVCYGQDSTHVWWHAWVETETGHAVGRSWRTLTIVAADEGGSLAQPWLAEREANDIADRIRRVAGGAKGPRHGAARVVYRGR